MKLAHALVLCKLFLAYQFLNYWYKTEEWHPELCTPEKSAFGFNTIASTDTKCKLRKETH